EAAVGLRARAGDDAGAARRTVRGAVLRPQRRRPRDRRQRGSLGGAGPCLRLFQQVRVLLLHRAGAAARRIARHAGTLHRGSGPAGQHPHAHALVYLLQERIADRRARRVLTHANGRPTWPTPAPTPTPRTTRTSTTCRTEAAGRCSPRWRCSSPWSAFPAG